MSEPEKLSPIEGIKTSSRYLGGPIPQELTDGNDHFGSDSIQLLKFHGTYQQDNRDERGAGGKSYIFMVRSKIPGGKLTSKQLLAQLDLCDELGNTTLRCTSRQGLQLHGVVKSGLHAAIRRINEIGLSTLGACGDINRNVMCCPAPYKTPIRQEMQALADRLASHFAARSASYSDIWLTDVETGVKERITGHGQTSGRYDGDEVEPIYGKTYLPRKFKMGVALPEDNCIDVYANDLGFLAIPRNGRIIGYNVLVGGSMGVTPANKKTFPAVAHRMAFVPAEDAVRAAEAVVKVQRDYGNRVDRKRARMKYLIHDWGLAKFKAMVEEYFGGPMDDPTDDDVYAVNDHIGWDEQGDGKLFYGLNIENGRIKDTEQMRLKTALREICTRFDISVRLTAHQSILFTDVDPADRGRIEETLHRHGVVLSEEISTVRRWSMACVAWPTCGLSITEAERELPHILDQLEPVLEHLGLADEKFTVRMTGCPNGCARPYNCDIGLVGKAREKYTIYLGGRVLGDRLNFLYRDMVPADEVIGTLSTVLAYYAQARDPGESLGDFCHRKGKDDLLAFAEQHAAPAAAE